MHIMFYMDVIQKEPVSVCWALEWIEMRTGNVPETGVPGSPCNRDTITRVIILIIAFVFW